MQVKIDIEGLLEKRSIRLSDLEKLVNLSYQQLWNIKEGRHPK
ncbi:MAG: hypothetical protein Q9M94_05230 [Candidatus Gracilibacteria bacterium]|nr:hypothetical protein [Candidatus Gracilibacteria bacterium]MDQ7023121.1 hypothetical protein [Candidatus Gracilibacteria bacterium]